VVHRTETTVTRAAVAQKQQRCGLATPALAEVRATRALADGVEVEFAQETPDFMASPAAVKT